MIHYVLFRFKPGLLDEVMKRTVETAYFSLKDALAGIKQMAVHYNCVSRQQNMDVMVELLLSEEAVLQEYLDHPIHLELVSKTKAAVELLVSFDHKLCLDSIKNPSKAQCH